MSSAVNVRPGGSATPSVEKNSDVTDAPFNPLWIAPVRTNELPVNPLMSAKRAALRTPLEEVAWRDRREREGTIGPLRRTP